MKRLLNSLESLLSKMRLQWATPSTSVVEIPEGTINEVELLKHANTVPLEVREQIAKAEAEQAAFEERVARDGHVPLDDGREPPEVHVVIYGPPPGRSS